jgi:DNA primase small subunit
MRYFKDDRNGILHGQDILRKGPHLSNMLETMMSISEREAVTKYLQDRPEASSFDLWQEFERLQVERAKNAETMTPDKRFHARREAKTMLTDIVIQYTYPRLDINVSKQMNHLLKAPFVVHPKTGRVCVPIDPEKADAFNPAEVPTIGRLIEDLTRSNDPRQTSLREYTHYFETSFLQPLERDIAQEMQLEGDLTF